MLDGMGGSVASEQQSEVDGMKVMVIDDSKTIRRTAETLLKKEGFAVVTATDGFEALSKITETPIFSTDPGADTVVSVTVPTELLITTLLCW